MKDAFYFPHDFNAHNDPKILRLAMEGWDLVGLYWSIVGMLHEQGGWLDTDPKPLAFALHADSERIAKLINYPGIFVIKGKQFTSQRVLTNLALRKDKSDKARKSAQALWNSKDRKHTNAMRTHSEGNAKKGNEIKGEEIINTYAEQVRLVFEHFCTTMNKKIQLSPERGGIIEQRLKEGRTVEEMKEAINNFSKDTWENRHQYCDLVYAIGTRNKVNNLDKWLNSKESKPKLLELG